MRNQIIGACSLSLALTAAASAQTRAGGEFRVNTATAGSQFMARTATEPDGDFIVVWAGQDGHFDGVFGQRFAASGAPRGAEFQVNEHITNSQWFPDVAVGRGGDFVIVWMSGQDGSGYSVRGRRYDAAGNPVGGEFAVNTFTPGDQKWPRVGVADNRGFVVSWASEGFDGNSYGIAARRFDSAGSPVGSDFLVNSYTTGDQVFNEMAVAADGSFVVVWEDFNGNRDGSASAIFGQRHGPSGNRLGGEFQVNSYTTGFQRLSAVSVSPAGGFVVAFTSPQEGSTYGVSARRFDVSGSPIGDDFVVNTYTTGVQAPDFEGVAHDALGNFVVTWGSDGQDGGAMGTFAQRFSASGVRRGAEFQVNTFTTGSQTGPAVVSDPVGNFVIAWDSENQDGQFSGVFAQRFGGLTPDALVVDNAGNRVLEPGETVDVRPSWRNINGAAQTFSATLTGLTGPAGATYTIGDGVGDYGTVPNGAATPCTDCYAITVSNPPTRPVLHWDASAVESIIPDAQGQQKKWRLHVGASFTDVPTTSGFYRFIEAMLHHDVTTGCGLRFYCPIQAATREQMAVFVLVGKEGSGYAPPACDTPSLFLDVPLSSPFCPWIEELARRGVVNGCGGGNYCPRSPVTREQMAVFVLRTLDPTLSPPACTTPIYGDVPASSGFCRWIEELTRRNVVTGCGGGNYCPVTAVTREEMAVFITVTFGLALYGP